MDSMKTALTIAGSDSSGGAGIQADIKTMTVHGVFAMSAVTALTAQNTLGVTDIMEASPDFLSHELDAVFTDIFPDAVKTGMVSETGLIEVIAAKLKEYGARNIVVDPVMVATSGARLISEDATGTLKKELLPLAAVITPNIPEGEFLADRKITSKDGMEAAAKAVYGRYGCAVLLKGGHSVSDADDLLYDGSEAIIAVIGQKMFSIHDKYCIDIYRPELEDKVVAILVTLQHMIKDREAVASSTSSSYSSDN
jgi:hydroxymethylpyrimidine/phosphomethylpyrimidine kinase